MEKVKELEVEELEAEYFEVGELEMVGASSRYFSISLLNNLWIFTYQIFALSKSSRSTLLMKMSL